MGQGINKRITINCMKCKATVATGHTNPESTATFSKGKGQFYILDNEKPKGTLIKNGSNNPDDWTGLCPYCQRSEDKNENS